MAYSARVFEKAIQLPRLGLLRLKERGYLATSSITISLAGRVYSCQHCGRVMDRDLNAAINLEQLLHC